MGLRPFWIVIPSRAPERGKTRLSPILAPVERRAFSRECLRHVIKVARGIAGPRHTIVVSRSGESLGLARRLGVQARKELRRGLNTAVRQAVDLAKRNGAMGVLVLPADLPLLAARDVACVIGPVARRRGIALAPDHARTGTNALALRPPGRFRFQFGPASFDKHRSQARRLRVRIHVIERIGLASDVDMPEHYLALRGQAPRSRG